MTHSYNPFGKPISEIEVADLDVLRTVSEGWYVEYKSQAIKPRDIAKSLTSFANQYGGFLIFGVAEKSGQDLTAGSFPGIPRASLKNLLTHIRDSSASHSNPAVHFEQTILTGPCKKLDLPSDHSVIVIEIASGLFAPYIHSSGRIYRRIGDSSEPQVENDRFQLGELMGRRDKLADRFKSFIESTDPTKRDQGILGWLQLFMFPDPDSPINREDLTTELVSEVFGEAGSSLPGPSMPATSLYPSGFGITAVQHGGGEPNTLGVSVHITHSGNACFCMPINLTPVRSFNSSAHRNARKFLSLLASKSHLDTLVADFSMVFVGVAAMLGQLLHLKDALGDDRNMLAGFRVSGLFGSIPFVDSPAYLSNIEKFGIPVLDFNETGFPSPSWAVDQLLRLEYVELDGQDEANAQTRPYQFGGVILKLILSCAGVSGLLDHADDQLFKDVYLNSSQVRGTNHYSD